MCNIWKKIRDFTCIRRDKFLASLSSIERIHTWIGMNTYTHYDYMSVILFQGRAITSTSEGMISTKIWFLDFKNANAKDTPYTSQIKYFRSWFTAHFENHYFLTLRNEVVFFMPLPKTLFCFLKWQLTIKMLTCHIINGLDNSVSLVKQSTVDSANKLQSLVPTINATFDKYTCTHRSTGHTHASVYSSVA
jgi:hypothetical protein